MGATSIGKLNVQVGANADQLNAVLNGANKTIASFVAKATSPVSGIGALVAGAAGGFGAAAAVSAAAGRFAKPMDAIGSVVSAFPGGELAAIRLGLTGLDESFNSTRMRMKELYHDSETLGISPKFLSTLQIAAGPDAEKVVGLMTKLQKTMAELKVGDLGVVQGKSGKLSKFMDIDALKDASPENQTRMVIEAMSKIEDHGQRAALGIIAFGKSWRDAMHLAEGGAAGLEKAAATVERLALADERIAGGVKEYNALRKEMDLLNISARQAAFAIELPNEKAKLAFARGDTGEWAKQKTKSWMNWIYLLSGQVTGQGLINTIPKADQGNKAFDPAANRLADLTAEIDDYTNKIRKETVELGLNADAKQRLELVTRGATAEQLKEFDAAASQRNAATAGDTLKKFTKDLEMQAATFGMSAAEAAAYKAELEGVGKAERDAALAAGGLLDIKKITAENNSPLDKMFKEIADINKLRGGFIDFDLEAPFKDFLGDKAANQAIGRKIRQGLNLDQLFAPVNNPSLVQAGSQEMFKAIDDAASRQESDAKKLDPVFIKDAISQIKANLAKIANDDEKLGAVIRLEGLDQ